MPRCFIYGRTSSRHQKELGIKSQVNSCEIYADSHGYDVAGVFTDEAVSGTTPLHKRPGLWELLQELRKGDVVLAYDRSRLGRDALVVLTIEAEVFKTRASIETVDGTTNGDSPEQVLLKRMMDCINEFQVQILRRKTSAALQQLKAEGRSTGNPPYGFTVGDDGTHLVEVETEKNIINQVIIMRSHGIAWAGVADELNKTSQNRSGRPWTLHGCYKVFKHHVAK